MTGGAEAAVRLALPPGWLCLELLMMTIGTPTTDPGSGAPPAAPPAAYLAIEDAAARPSTTTNALRARCRRHSRREGRDVVARLGAGVVAVKIGFSWRVRFPAYLARTGRDPSALADDFCVRVGVVLAGRLPAHKILLSLLSPPRAR